MRIDDSTKTVRAGFRDFIGDVDEERWDLPAMPNRPILGIRAHRAYAARRQSESGFESEVPVALSFSRRGYTFELKGRIDGLYRRDDRLVVEEVKSMTLEGGELTLLTSRMFPSAALQLSLYCYATHLSGGVPVYGRLVFASVFGPDEHDVGLAWSMEEAEAFIYRRADEILDEHEARLRWLDVRQRAAPDLPFPFEARRPVQIHMGEELRQALTSGQSILMEAPTGSGKTAVALYETIKWAFETGHRVMFVTAKTSGQRAAREVITRLRDRGAPVSSVTITARTKICPQEVVYCHPDYCPFARDYQEKLRRSAIVPTLLSEGVVVRRRLEDAGDDIEVCPFELSLELTTRTDVVICDYNYVFHPLIRLKRLFDSDKPQSPLVVIVDEAHNLVGRSRDYYSPTLSARLFMKVKEHAQGRAGRFGRRLETVIVDVLLEMERWIMDSGLEGMPEGKGPWEPDVEALRGWQQQLAQLLMDDPVRRRWRPMPGEEDALLDAYRHLSHTLTVLDTLDPATFVSYVEQGGGDMKAGILCLDASEQLARSLKDVSAAVMMSATLTPQVFYSEALGLKSGAIMSSFPSPFPPENRGIFIADDVTTRYREREASMPEVARLITQVAALVPGNYAVFVPSYAYLRKLRRYLDGADFEILADDRRADDLARRAILLALEAPLQATGLFRGAAGRLLLGVQGGSFAEAVEWPAGILKGIFVVGPGLPAVGFEQEQLRAYYDGQMGDGFDYAYLHPGMTRVVQAAGRLIRRAEDKGIIVLLDERFRWRTYAKALPRHWYDHSVDELVAPDLVEGVAEFWRGHGLTVEIPGDCDPTDGQSW